MDYRLGDFIEAINSQKCIVDDSTLKTKRTPKSNRSETIRLPTEEEIFRDKIKMMKSIRSIPRGDPVQVGNSGIFYYDKEEIGFGASSIVYNGYHNDPRRPAAVKRIISTPSNSVSIGDDELNELKVWLEAKTVTLENLNIVQLFAWSQDFSGTAMSYYFAMELATCDLEARIQEFIKEPGKAPDEKLMGYIKDAAHGLLWLHTRKKPIIHRDIKPKNILIFDSGNFEIAKLTDFGISRIFKNSITGTDTGAEGTLDWMTPESIMAMQRKQIFRNKPSLDIFSLGMTYHYTLSIGEHPFEIIGGFTFMNICDPRTPPKKLIGLNSISANHLCQWMMSKESSGRPGIQQVISHCSLFSELKCLKFICGIAISLDNRKCDMANKARNELDSAFSEIYCKARKQDEVNWKRDLGDEVFKLLTYRNSTGRCFDPYNETSAVSLVVLIRDKHMHRMDMLDLLVKDKIYFADDTTGNFSNQKYISFFLYRFPELMPVLWTTVATKLEDSEFPFLSTVKDEYDLYQYKIMPGLSEHLY